jgi:hypothetical protein
MAVPFIPQSTVLSYSLYVKAKDSQMKKIGQVQSISISESRDVTPNFVIGNDPPDQADGLIPGVVKTRTAQLSRVRLYAKSLREVFGRDDQSILASLSDQNTPVDIVAVVKDPNSNKTKTITLKDGFLGSVDSTLDMNGDIREIEKASYTFLYIVETAYQ